MNLLAKILGLFSRSIFFLIAVLCAVALGAYLAFVTYQTVFYIPNVHVPPVVNLDLDSAQERLHQNGLKMNVVNDSELLEGELFFVVSQKPQAGTEIKKNRTVEVEIGGDTVRQKIPDLVGRTIQEAENLLSEYGYRIGNIAYTAHPQFPEGRIIAQTPEPGENTSTNGDINILVSKGLY